MSLRVWLPLTKDLRNQGLDNVTVMNNGATFISAGKLGGCYSFSGNAIYGELSNTNEMTSMSGCCWVYLTNLSSAQYFFHLGGISSYPSKIALDYEGSIRSQVNGVEYNSGITLAINTWYHIAVTVGENKVKWYLNGEEKASTSISGTFNASNHLAIGARINSSAGNTFAYPITNGGRLNDVRIYNHCLSPMEVKELAKGLVLHYPLSSGNLIDINNITDGAYLNSNGGITGTNGWCYTDYIPVYSNSQYVCTGLSKGGSGTYIVLYDNTKTKTRTLLLTANQNLDITTSDIEKYIRLSIRELANELTTTARFVYMSPIEYDCSGFCNNGNKITNTITYTSDTAKYAVSTHFNGTYDGIIIENLALKDIINSAVTYAFWIKPESESGARSVYFGSYNTGPSWSIEKTTGNVIRSYWNGSPDETCSGATITDGVWQHVCLTKSGTNNIKIYINGVQKWASTATHSNLNFPTTFRIGRDTRSNDGTPYKGLMSDFRIYATALSAEDVKSLYQNSAYIDSSGNVYGAVHTEV